MKNLFLFLILICISTHSSCKDLVEVTRVIDGDTIEVLFNNGNIERIRLVGIDCPESIKINQPDEYKGISDIEYLHNWAVHIKEYMQNRVFQKKVILEYDSEAGHRGYFGRLLAYIILDGENLNIELVRKGFARVYSEAPCELMSDLLAAQEEAIAVKRGIWSGSVIKADTIRNNFIIATDVHYNAKGNDNNNLNDEYFALKNISNSPLDLSFWIISDARGKHTYTFPDGFILKPHKVVYIYSGSGRDSEGKLYWHSNRAIWNNIGDKIYILNPMGAMYELYSWK